MVTPDEEAEHCDRDTRVSDEVVAKDFFSREAGYQLADHAHAGEDHDVDRRVRIEPEEMLKEQRIATERGIKNADTESAFERHEREGDREHWGREHKNDAGGVKRPDEKRQARPGHSRSAHFVSCDDEVQAGGD